MPTTIILRETSRPRPRIWMMALVVFYAVALLVMACDIMANDVGMQLSDAILITSP